MNKSQVVVAIVVALMLGIGVSLLAGGFDATAGRASQNGLLASANTSEALAQERTVEPTDSTAPTEPPRPTAVPATEIVSGPPADADLEDVILLSNSSNATNFDALFCNVAAFYGLGCRQFDLQGGDLTAANLQDAAGQGLRLIAMSGSNLPALSPDEVNLLRSAVEGGSQLLVYEVDGTTNLPLLNALANDAVQRVTDHNDAVRNWVVSTAAPEVTLEFTGQEIQLTEVMEQTDWALELNPRVRLTRLIGSVDDFSQEYAIFAMVPVGQGVVFLNAGDKGEAAIRTAAFRELYYNAAHFSKIVPMMIALRHAAGDEAWHQDINYANLTLDGVPLVEVVDNLNYVELLREMDRHNFHTTIAMPPVMADQTESLVVSLFIENPDRYSLVQNGNNRDGYEFYHYEVANPAESEHAARPLFEQEADIREGLERMLGHTQQTSVPFDRVMIFPYGISPSPTLNLLKQLNYLATVNAQDVPLGEQSPQDWDFAMQQANHHFEGFPVLARRQFINSYQNPDPFIRSSAFDLFIDRPVLFWSTPTDGQLFTKGSTEFNLIADRINAIPGVLEWRGLGDILLRLHKQKLNDDGSVDVMMCCNRLLFENDSASERVYHVMKPETGNVAIRQVTANGFELPYRIEEGLIIIDMRVPAHSEVEILIEYGGE